MAEILTNEYGLLLSEVKKRIRDAQYEALKAVNKELISLYWDIGRLIVEKQEGETWGKSIVENLAQDLQNEFPGIGGFSARNIWRMRDFYLEYHQNEILTPLVAEIGWSHNTIILSSCKDDLQREFYIRWTKKFGWTKAVLLHQIQNKTYEKTLSSQTNFDKTVPEDFRNQAKLAVKDEYTFDFLELGENYKERELEKSLISKVEDFLREMGGIFTFVGSQYRLEIDGREFFIDLLLYHRRLRCLVAIELKIGEFQPEYVGKMQFYLAALDDLVKMPNENASIGLILCQSKTKTIVEYALRESNKPIGVSQYKISSELPEELKGELPEPEQIVRLLREN
jgi:predicted nuclease of restriction endonuclease-like (RecB) superfamily